MDEEMNVQTFDEPEDVVEIQDLSEDPEIEESVDVEHAEPEEKTTNVLFDSEEGIDNTTNETSGIPEEKDLRHVDEEAQEEKQDVVKDRILDQQVIIGSRCPICGSLDKQAVKLIAYRKGFLSLFKKHKSKEVGIAQICRTCGYFRIHSYNINETLAFLRGDTKAINFNEQPTTTKGDQDNG